MSDVLSALVEAFLFSYTGQSVKLGIRDQVPTLRYRNGNCMWSITVGNLSINVERPVGSTIKPPDEELLTGYILICVVGEEVKLNVMVSLYGEP